MGDAGARIGSLPKADLDLLLGSKTRLRAGLKEIAGGAMGRRLDERFGGFAHTAAAREIGLPSSASGTAIAPDIAIIRSADLRKYEEVVSAARESGGRMAGLDALMGRCNTRLAGILDGTILIYRGTLIGELETVSIRGGAFGFHKRAKYAAVPDFVSFTVSSMAAALFASRWLDLGLVVVADISKLDRGEYAAVTYEARNIVRVTGAGRRLFNPYERFGGRQSGLLLPEAEVHIRVGSRPAIRAILVMGPRSARFRRRLDRVAASLGRLQGQMITVMYVD
ncbi:MAG: hypothetical protein MPI95_03440 [Nitrosopumilus sp.]|nr:hypothetical protein [Nitrosopumilus sp.]MDA7958131.1 hypothetical protein [Nitrosopumilus sp.]